MKYNALFSTLLIVFATSLATTATKAQTFPAGGGIGYLDGAWINSPDNPGDPYDNYGASAYVKYAGPEDAGAQLASYNGYKEVTWSNGHANNFDPFAGTNTTIRFGNDGAYFWLYVEVPIEAKSMIWTDDLNDFNDGGPLAAEWASYQLGGDLLHDEPGRTLKKGLNLEKAIGSEKLEFINSSGDIAFTANFEEATGLADIIEGKLDPESALRLVGAADAIDYLFSELNPDGSAKTALASEELSTNYDKTMSFEFVFELDGTDTDKNTQIDAILGTTAGGVVFHLSPPKIPEPSSALLLGLASIGMLLRRRR